MEEKEVRCYNPIPDLVDARAHHGSARGAAVASFEPTMAQLVRRQWPARHERHSKASGKVQWDRRGDS